MSCCRKVPGILFASFCLPLGRRKSAADTDCPRAVKGNGRLANRSCAPFLAAKIYTRRVSRSTAASLSCGLAPRNRATIGNSSGPDPVVSRSQARSMHDLLFRNALTFDGTGSPPSINDVAVTDGRISAVGPTLRACARALIAADGLALMPGIIDSHTHFDAQIIWDPYVRPSPALGVTTV